ncbi:complex I NDUFA9 subunit family protein [Methylophilus medardicus]|uniref:Complex I NDUFA9 subunit family protein n=1 Tax=Methylophilus medardicus TaxID=2588534 RepID=A0A5B8CUF7_9PROT|nr:complex I NDUFA9 subunit family protein [Methylophilus medardicus]QDC44931.1 complex I NDUFA9 subunit family protein [Methylophilus medardicus]QDC49938.1 complex I NDUFA9 subunit family protein [Methylophilus medardicus]QDC53643.1 complex I NDUFA9 subunit family protein [Methylophilus medardicus]
MMKKVTVLGGSGFVGSSVIARLDQAGYQVKVLTRRREQAKHLILLPNVQVVEANIHEPAALKAQLQGSDVVINLIGILHQTRDNGFEKMHHQFPRRVAQLCDELHIPRLLHMSALQASVNGPSEYLRSKAAGDLAVMEFSKKLHVTIFRPSVIFGTRDRFINLFAKLIQVVPVLALAMPQAKFQPIWVEDVAAAMVNSVEESATYGKTYELGGPAIMTLQQIIEAVMNTIHVQRPILGLNLKMSLMQGSFMQKLPIKLLSRDNVKSMQVDNVCQQPMANELCVVPTDMFAVISGYLVKNNPRGAYDQFRAAAGRVINARR